MQQGIKEISELIDGLEAVGVPVAVAMADGKINALDLPQALELVKAHEKILAAVQGLDGVIPEAKDIDSVEAVAIVQKLMAAAQKIKAAHAKASKA
jgi:hypothetical protein